MTDKPYADPTTVALKAVEIAQERPEYIYSAPHGQGCKYVHDRETTAPVAGCLFGHALLALGAPVDEIPEGTSIGGAVNLLRNGEPKPYREWTDLDKAMGATQDSQDNDVPWGSAIEPLVRELERQGLLP